jgi:peptidoglycan hydrolase-like protein with peptidoglycan-binding domain
MVNGRGAWNVSGLGGTKKYKDGTKPGPYYYIGSGKGDTSDPNVYAVKGAVKAYQRALNRRLDGNLLVDGIFGPVTSGAVTKFQEKNEAATGTPWGGIGPDTSKALLLPDLKVVWRQDADPELPLRVVSGTIRHESNWDAGAVGYVDPRDVGLAQINADAHPEWSIDTRLQPYNAFRFVVAYYNESLPYFKGNVRDAIASYNLGRGGARSWIRAGRPDTWTPAGSTTPRDVKGYIDSILKG